MTEALRNLLKEAEGKTPMDFPNVYNAETLQDPTPLKIALKLCEQSGIDTDTVTVAELAALGKAHIAEVWSVTNNGRIKLIKGYDLSGARVKELEAIYVEWESQKEESSSGDKTKTEMETANEKFSTLMKRAAKLAFANYPANGATQWEGFLTMIDISTIFGNFEKSTLGESLAS